MTTDWAAIKNRYETQGKTTAELAEEFGISKEVVDYAVENEKWRHRNVEKMLIELEAKSPKEEAVETLTELLKNKYSLAEILKDERLQPKYHILEAVVLKKAVEVISSIQQDLPSAGLQLSQAMNAVKALYETSKAGGKAEDNDKTAKGLTVKILNHVGS